jgi:uncharacterized membrane protein (DUF2068 family)
VDAPLESLRAAELAVVLTGALGLMSAWSVLFPRLNTEAAPRGIVSLELCWTADRARRIVDSWERQRMSRGAKRSVFLDVPFILFYTSALAVLGLLAARAASATGMLGDRHAETAAALVAIAALAAAILDLIEDLGLWLMLRGHFVNGLPSATSHVALAKWTIVALIVAAALAALAVAGVRAV